MALVKIPVKNDHLCGLLQAAGVRVTSLYKCGDITYMDIAPLLPVLSVSVDWLKRNTRDPRYYIEDGRRVYVSKYGITKLLSESREEVSFKLQDYLFELLYTAETQTTMSATDLKSRAELLDCIEKITASLTEYKAEKNEELEDLRCTYGELEAENKKLTKANNKLTDDVENLKDELAEMRKCASVLAKFARNKSKIVPKIASSESLDVSSDDDMEQLVHDSRHAYRAALQPVRIHAERKDLRRITSLMRSAESIDLWYTWSLAEKVDERFKLESARFLETDENPPADTVWFADLELTDWCKKILEIFIELVPQCREDQMSRVIERIV
jgi:DNA repair exonuclease SbcCD ATPase subunit